MKTEDFQVYLDFILDQIVGFMPRFLGGIFVLLIGWWLIKQATRVANKLMKRRKVEDTLRDFFKTIIRIALWVMLLTSVVTMIGIETTSVLALLTSIGVAVGLALSGTLQNFAGGLLILLMRHIKVGDEVEAQGHAGIIERIELFYTILITWDNEKVILPNGPLSTQV
ncbi:MAG: mechanosensitive ion channel family protein, partial [Bacteroidota bacterium]